MFNITRLAELKEELAVAERDAKPVIIELTSETKDERVYTNLTTGTVRKDYLGGPTERYEERPVVVEEVSPFEKPIDPTVGKVVSQDDTKRTIALVSGTKRVDLK